MKRTIVIPLVGVLEVAGAVVGMVAAMCSRLIWPAFAAEIDTVPGHKDSIWLHGRIRQGDAQTLQSVLDYRIARGFRTDWIIVESEGGSAMEGFKLADIIRRYGINTIVGSNTVCASSCFTLFAAGRTRWFWPSGQIGVHSVSVSGVNGYPEENVGTAVGSVVMAKVYKAMGVPEVIIGKMVTTPANDISWLTWEDMRGWASIAGN